VDADRCSEQDYDSLRRKFVQLVWNRLAASWRGGVMEGLRRSVAEYVAVSVGITAKEREEARLVGL
jgi:hypothetical protein